MNSEILRITGIIGIYMMVVSSSFLAVTLPLSAIKSLKKEYFKLPICVWCGLFFSLFVLMNTTVLTK